MSILFPKVNKMPEWNFRPRFYDPEQEKRKERMQRLQTEKSSSEHHTTLHRGSFREARDEKFPRKNTARTTSRIAFWIALLAMLIFCFYYLF